MILPGRMLLHPGVSSFRRVVGGSIPIGSRTLEARMPPVEDLDCEATMDDQPVNDSIAPTSIAEARARQMFERVLVGWASDLLHLRRQGLTTPGWRVADPSVVEDGLHWRRAA